MREADAYFIVIITIVTNLQLVANAVRDHGMAGMALATIFCGAIQMATGAMKVGGIVKLTPMPVMAGFMAGIGTSLSTTNFSAACVC